MILMILASVEMSIFRLILSYKIFYCVWVITILLQKINWKRLISCILYKVVRINCCTMYMVQLSMCIFKEVCAYLKQFAIVPVSVKSRKLCRRPGIKLKINWKLSDKLYLVVHVVCTMYMLYMNYNCQRVYLIKSETF